METKTVDLLDVQPHPQNVRQGDIGAIVESLKVHGQYRPIVVQRSTGFILAGNHTWKAARTVGLKTLDVTYVDVDDDEALRILLIDNRSNDLATYDDPSLVELLKQLMETERGLTGTGFDGDDLDELLATMDFQPPELIGDPDDVPEVPKVAVTKLGDIWKLGDYRLMCGDSTKPETYRSLMRDERAQMVFTDPPWNVAIGKDSNPRHRQRKGLENDDMSSADFSKFLSGFASACRDYVDGDFYCVLGASEWPNLDTSLRGAGFHWSATIIWVKDLFVLGRSKYHRRYEPIWYGWNDSGKSSFNDARNLDDVWEIDRPRRSEEHPTMKPVELMVRAVNNSSHTGGVVLDPFGGSGSTLIACEQTGRKCRTVELEPLYCDVIVQRWETLTGKKAELLSTESTQD